MNGTGCGLNDLSETLAAALKSQRVGHVVCVRMHMNLRESTRWMEAVGYPIQLLRTALELDSFSWRVRRGSGGCLLNLLGESPNGQTALLTLARGGAATIGMTVYGNHGVVRLDECVLLDDFSAVQWQLPQSLEDLLEGC